MNEETAHVVVGLVKSQPGREESLFLAGSLDLKQRRRLPVAGRRLHDNNAKRFFSEDAIENRLSTNDVRAEWRRKKLVWVKLLSFFRTSRSTVVHVRTRSEMRCCGLPAARP